MMKIAKLDLKRSDNLTVKLIIAKEQIGCHAVFGLDHNSFIIDLSKYPTKQKTNMNLKRKACGCSLSERYLKAKLKKRKPSLPEY